MNPIAVEIFAGAGGLSLGLQYAGFDIILATEVQKDFARTLEYNNPRTKVLCADIYDVDFVKEITNMGYDVGDIDLLSGGPPCQGFSTIGSKNENDPRNNLLYEYIRAVKEIRPKYALFENVSGFKRMFKGYAYNTLIEEFAKLEYQTTSAILDASDFGLPQKRLRTIIIAWRNDQKPANLPTPFTTPKLSLMDAISDLPELSVFDEIDEYALEPQNDYQKALRGVCVLLTEHNSSNYGPKMQKILRSIPQGGSVEDIPKCLRPKSYYANTYARLLPNEPSPTITRNFGTPSSSRCVHPFQDRALSTREGARLQSFPDYYEFFGGKTSKNLQIGNAVPPLLGMVIAKEIMDALNK